MTLLSRRWKILALVGLALMAAAVAFGVPLWQGLCGNGRYQLYGQLIDENNHGVAGAVVEVRFLYSTRIGLPLPYGTDQQTRIVRTATDDEGNFHVGPIYA
ncbi:MAG TPA: hypothetical protein VH518_23765, partial [Tepidisphaeraceae bacterium]